MDGAMTPDERQLPDSQTVRLHMLEQRLAQHPDCIETRFERAGLLGAMQRYDAAKREYLDLLARAPTHFGALNDFASLLITTGYRDAARTAYAHAVQHHPDNPTGRVNFANLLFLLGEISEARLHFEAAIDLDPTHIHAHRGLANVLANIGDDIGARRHRDNGFRNNFLTTLPYYGDAPPVSVLLLVSAIGGNVPMSALLDDRTFQTIALATEYDDPTVPLPPHHLVLNSIGDADLCPSGLEAARRVLDRTNRPVINHPSAVLETGRVANAERLGGLPGVLVPSAASLRRDIFADSQAPTMLARMGFQFPLLLRAPGFHTGRHFVRVERREDLQAAADLLPGPDVTVLAYLDAKSGDGKFRKYRVMIVDGEIYPLHAAISNDWKVHYFTAEMAHSPEHRAEDAAFLQAMPEILGANGMRALGLIRDTLELDYGGIDFSVNQDGEILFFEANATMIVPAPLTDEKWAYRRPAIARIFSAVHQMLFDRSRRGHVSD